MKIRPVSGHTKESIHAFVFDAYGTLFDVRSVIPALDRKFPGHGATLSNAWRTRQLEYTWLRSLMGRYEDFWAITESALVASCDALKLRLEAHARAELMEGYLRLEPFPEVKQALQSLSSLPLAILSNGSPRMLRAIVNAARLDDAFVQIISVDSAKIYKPSPKVYQLAVRRLGVAKKHIAFVSSNYWDVAGAKTFGFRTYWVDRSGAAGEELGAKPDATVKSLSDLVVLAMT